MQSVLERIALPLANEVGTLGLLLGLALLMKALVARTAFHQHWLIFQLSPYLEKVACLSGMCTAYVQAGLLMCSM